MESLEKKYADLIQALQTFKDAINFRNHTFKNQDLTDATNLMHFCIVRDSVIQRFEYCYELLWHYLMLHIEIKHGSFLEFKAPAYVFRKACEIEIIDSTEVEQALEMTKMRNKTSHIYKEEIADYVAKAAENHLALMQQLAARLKP